MKKIFNFIKLDFMSIKPYITLKNLLIYIVVALITSFGSESYTSAVAIFITFTMLYATYPFAVGDQNGIDSLYTILGISKKDVVKGRYGFLLIMSIIGMMLGFVVYLLLSFIFKTPINLSEAMFGTVSSILVLSINHFILYPVFFKNGYIKSKSLVFLPLMIIGLIAILSVQFFKGKNLQILNEITQFLVSNPLLVALAILIIWFVILMISYKKSYKHYVRREF